MVKIEARLIRLDDIAECMNWYLMNKCETLFNKHSIKPLLGVIPNNQDKDLLKQTENSEFWNKVRGWQNQGWEIAMHGYTHIYDSETKKKDYWKEKEISLTQFISMLASFQYNKHDIQNSIKLKGNNLIISSAKLI